MDELVKLVMEKSGLDEATAKMVVVSILEFLKDKAPEPFDTLLDAVLTGETAIGDLGSFASGLGGLFAKK